MKRFLAYWTILFVVVSAAFVNAAKQHELPQQKEGYVTFYFSGTILDPHKNPVKAARVRLFVNNQPHRIIADHKEVEEVETSSHGTYQFAFQILENQVGKSKIELEIYKSAFEKTMVTIPIENVAIKGCVGYFSQDITLKRKLNPAFYIGTAIFVLTYIVISFELLHRTVAALAGGSLIMLVSYTLGTINPEYRIISYETAIAAIDMNVIFLLMGMMIIIGVLKHTGVFQWCAYMSYKIAKGNVMALSFISCIFIAFTSAFLDNVTTMLLYTPVLMEIAIALHISPITLLLPGIIASNIGGTATLIGDPPNIIIGSYTGLTFMEFVYNLTVPVVVSTIVLYFYVRLWYGKEYKKGKVDDVDAFIAKLREEYKITDRVLLGYGLIIMAIVIAFFASHGYWHMEVSIPALFGAASLFIYGLLTKKIHLYELLEKDIEWPTLIFFIFLFVLVGAVEEVGLLAIIADWVLQLSKGNLTAAICLILWVAAIASAFVDNIPFTATMLPIVAYLTKSIPGAENNVLWWALSLGACFGGNGTIIGASANVVTIGIAEAKGYRMSFMGFMKIAFPYMIISVIISNIWLILFY
ncbi:MAG: ArsB/NhaD family transporter [Syntrophobacterales bacterium]|nr:ArsB/NhaD family transporter [Syntrophobacterales bacterium]